MERRPPSDQGRNRSDNAAARFKDAKGALSKNDMQQGRGAHHDSHEHESNEAFLARMNDKLKDSSKQETDDS